MNPKAGDIFHSSVAPIAQEDINRFGELHGTNGKTHTDPEFARTSVFGGVIVQGALVMAPIFGLCDELFAGIPARHIEVEAKFIGYTRPGDAVSIQFTVTAADTEQVALDYSCAVQDGRKVQAGTVVLHRAV